jgi:mannose-6-phosphate isomerase-like protein (cupin superfamily)
MSDYAVLEIGGLDRWREHLGGFRPDTTRQGRRVLDHELPMQYIGATVNVLEPGEEAGYWHTHSEIEELYVFLSGQGQLALDDDIVNVGPGTTVRVGQDVWRTWRSLPDSVEPLRWLCIRAGGTELPRMPQDATRSESRPAPW